MDITPSRLQFLETDQPMESTDQDDRYAGPLPIDQEHGSQATDCAKQRRGPMAEAKSRPIAGVFRDRLVERRQIQQSVRDHEEHRDQGCDGIQIGSEDTQLSNCKCQYNRSARFIARPATAAENAQPAKYIVASKGLQDPWSAHHTAKCRRQRSGKHACGYQRGPPCDIRHHQIVVYQLLMRTSPR